MTSVTLKSGEVNLEETIKKVYATLKRTENRTLETKRRTERTLEKCISRAPSIDLQNDQNIESLLFANNFGNQEPKSQNSAPTIEQRQSSTVDTRTAPQRVEHNRSSPNYREIDNFLIAKK